MITVPESQTLDMSSFSFNEQNETHDGIVLYEAGQVKRTEKHSFIGGSCSDVYRAEVDGLPVVVKVYRGLPYVEGVAKQFFNLLTREVKEWARMSHPNVVPLYGIAQDLGHLPGLVMPEYRKGNLDQFLFKNSNADRLRLLLDVVHGLHYLHTLKSPVYHGELKASNIMIDDDERALIGDIGQATLVSEMVFTRPNCCTSGRWCAPEMMDPESFPAIYRDKSDIYGFGMLMLETFTGKMPFHYIRLDAKVIFDVVKGRRPNRPSVQEAPQLTDELWVLMTECWNHDQMKRPSAGEVLNRLHACCVNGSLCDTKTFSTPSARL